MWKTLIAISAGILILGTLFKLWTVLRRRAVLDGFDEAALVRVARGVSMKAMVYGTSAFKGLNPRRNNRTVGELILTADRFVISTARGVLVDIGPERGRKFTSVRCTGPGRLVIEGDIPRPEKDPAPWRFELVVEDAVAWADSLAPYVRETEESRRYATAPPWMKP